ncbi:Mediator of RNA polymerase II transcription subunit 20 [Amphibalanus amphitrite]|uniref:Mediator of RNA polymerase II transcription subunit 20 n=1 Tax=Amphibalanus amphitrite TaxID=1232801 RepID=A0A6A4UXM4_AMPAM|nr:Mediator of RNA polymerase II transcription subunit 20 [Amphibalanus amphitrite]
MNSNLFTKLQTFPLIEGLTGPQTLDVLHKRITALGARVSGQFVVDCETYFSAPSLCYDPPNRKAIAGRLLDQTYDKMKAEMREALAKTSEVTLVQDGWSDVSNSPVIAHTIHAPGGGTFFLNSKWVEDMPKTAENCALLAEEAIEEARSQYGVKVTGLVTDNAKNMQNMRRIINQRHPEIAVWGCASHLLNLVGSAVTPSDIMKYVVAVHKWYRNHHNAGAWLAQKEGTVRPQLPAETRWNSQVDTLKSFIRNRQAYVAISAEHEPEMDETVTQRVNSLGLYRSIQDLVCQLEPIAEGVDRLQSDSATLADTVAVFQDLLDNQALAPHHATLERRKSQAVTSLHLAAYLVHPRYMGQNLTTEEFDEAMAQFKEDLHPQITKFHGQLPPFPSSFFSAGMKQLPPTEWWCGAAQRPGVSKELGDAAMSLLSKPPSSASIERTFSSFGLVQTKLRNRLGHATAEKLVFCYRMLQGTAAEDDDE